MVFTFEDYRSLVQMLYEHPEWREELRPLVLSEELLRLPETQARTDAALAHLSANLDRMEAELSARIAQLELRTDQRFDAVDQRFDAVDQRFDAVDQRFDAVDQRFDAVDHRFDKVEASLGEARQGIVWLRNRMARVDGRSLEYTYRGNAGAVFGKWLRHPTLVSPYDLGLVEDALASGQLTEADMEQLRSLDLLVSGTDKSDADHAQLLFAVEISVTIDVNDIRRAAERAAILRRVGYEARGFAGGEASTEGADQLAAQEGVLIDLRGVPA